MDAYDVDTNVLVARLSAAMMRFCITPVGSYRTAMCGIRVLETACILTEPDYKLWVSRYTFDDPDLKEIKCVGLMMYKGYPIDVMEIHYRISEGFMGYFWNEGKLQQRCLVTAQGEYVSPVTQQKFMQDVSATMILEMEKIDDYIKRKSNQNRK